MTIAPDDGEDVTIGVDDPDQRPAALHLTPPLDALPRAGGARYSAHKAAGGDGLVGR
ncbi:hypothetical protein RI138_11530 [Streptomyces sp. C11-1]|uniref:Uncharacterized protein n=1 Tax=Streptomyces durocortorensis TaxID=2811104 RepID=A0ABY9VU17_9ACTN|nr:hypothetical protein [Streptomyces durocortorensis]WNF27417.1 hypothetical protein RI138_11530 [Streptomyces durocortorensis]